MKRIITLIISILIIQVASAQIRSVGILAGGGGTLVDVEKVLEPYELSEWDTWSLVFKAFAEYSLGENSAIGLELGSNRLYYWEYKAPGYSYYNWRTEWTKNAVLYYITSIGEKLYIQSGIGVHVFNDGTVAGLMAGFGTLFPAGEKFTIPLFLRVEPVFGSGTPVAVNIGTGLKINLKKKE